MYADRTGSRASTTESRDWGPRGTAGVSFAATLTFEKVCVKLGPRTVLDELDLALVPGEVVCLLGESGSGKSTLLRVAAGLQRVDAGRVLINNKVVSAPDVHLPPEKRGVGLMFQDFALFPHLTVLENARFGLNGQGRDAARERAITALARVGLADRADEYPHNLSGGQQQRLALARSIAPRPGILMLDEPFSGLDARLRETVRAETLAVLHETNATSLMVTHDPEEAMLLGDRVALLRKGRIVQIGVAAEVYRNPVDLAAARFLSPLTELHCRVKGDRVRTPLGDIPAMGHADGAKVVVALRPVGALHVTNNPGGVPGRIVSRRNALGVDIMEVLVAGIDRPLQVRRQSEPGQDAGTDVFVTLNPKDVLVFAED